jgi:hypothetical protein
MLKRAETLGMLLLEIIVILENNKIIQYLGVNKRKIAITIR